MNATDAKPMTNADRAEAIAEMMEWFSTATARCRAQYPDATDEEVFQKVSAAMSRSLGLDRPRSRRWGSR